MMTLSSAGLCYLLLMAFGMPNFTLVPSKLRLYLTHYVSVGKNLPFTHNEDQRYETHAKKQQQKI